MKVSLGTIFVLFQQGLFHTVFSRTGSWIGDTILRNIDGMLEDCKSTQFQCAANSLKKDHRLSVKEVVKKSPIWKHPVTMECILSSRQNRSRGLISSSDPLTVGYPLVGSSSITRGPIFPENLFGRTNFSRIEDWRLNELTECSTMTFPQISYFLQTGKFQKLNDICINAIDSRIFGLLTPYLVERVWEFKPACITWYWPQFNPEALARSSSVVSNLLADKDRNSLCCSLRLSDFPHVGYLSGISSECAANMAIGDKCADLEPSWFSYSPSRPFRHRFNDSTVIKVIPDSQDISSFKLAEPPEPSDRIFPSVRRMLLQTMSDSCFDSMPNATKIALWINFNDTDLEKQLVTHERSIEMEKLIRDSPDIVKRVHRIDSSSSAKTPIIEESSASSSSTIKIMAVSIISLAFILIV
jgi:hypothetical protein